METKISDLLHSLAITGNYRGYRCAVTACIVVYKDEHSLHSVMHNVYPVVAKECNCREQNVERNIRTVILHAWKCRRDRFNEIAGYTLKSPPKVSEFLAIITSYIRKIEQKEK